MTGIETAPPAEDRRYEDPRYPAWVRELDLALPITPQVLLTGNIRDRHPLPLGHPGGPGFIDTTTIITDCLRENDVQVVLQFDVIDGLTVLHESEPGLAAGLVPAIKGKTSTPLPVAELPSVVRAVVQSTALRAAIVIDYASRLRQDENDNNAELHTLLSAAEKLIHTAVARSMGNRDVPLFNTVVWLVDREGDLPHWLASTDSMRVISIAIPTLTTRLDAASRLMGSFPGAMDASPDDLPKWERRFAELTHGMTFRGMSDLAQLARDRDIPLDRIDEAARVYRVGILDNPWQSEGLRQRIMEGEEIIGRRVLGQPKALRKSLDILTRATTGLTGAQSGGHSARPQGILFFAGPTGVGKTEMAKSLAEVLFGTEDAYTRFDMSEFSAEHTEARLIGAPPGYIGHDAGGELTNAVRQRPFSVLLFDEIEKAHPRILDKFLQILEDGRLTDGSGSTVYFSESVIVFTSNLGIYRTVRGDEKSERVQLVGMDEPYEKIERTVRSAIHDHFTIDLQRPELLNRIGDNIVVFDFIREDVGRRLVDHFVGKVVSTVKSKTGVEVDIAPDAQKVIAEAALANRSFGGRGIGSALETVLINPLARELFARDQRDGAVTITSVTEGDYGWELTLE